MEKLKFYKNSPEFKQGQKDFKNGNIKNEGIKAVWLKAKVDFKKWATHYSKIPGYTFLEKDKEGEWIGFCGAGINSNVSQIINVEDLRKIQIHREAIGWYPRPMEKVK